MKDLLSPIAFLPLYFSSSEVIQMLLMAAGCAALAWVFFRAMKVMEEGSSDRAVMQTLGGVFAVFAGGLVFAFVVIPILVPVVIYGFPCLVFYALGRIVIAAARRRRTA